MRTVKILGLIVAILGLLTAIVALITEGLKLYRELPTQTPQITTVVATLPESTSVPTAILQPSSLFQDDFSKNSGRWETYGPWKIEDDAFQINISGADLPHAAAFAYPFGDNKEWSNFSYEVDHMCESGGNFSAIYFRQTEAGAYFLRLFWDSTSQWVALGKNDAGGKNDINLKSQEFNLATNNWYHLKVTAVDNKFWVYINNQLILEHIDNQTSLLHGGVVLAVYGQEGEIRCSFDNVKIVEEAK